MKKGIKRVLSLVLSVSLLLMTMVSGTVSAAISAKPPYTYSLEASKTTLYTAEGTQDVTISVKIAPSATASDEDKALSALMNVTTAIVYDKANGVATTKAKMLTPYASLEALLNQNHSAGAYMSATTVSTDGLAKPDDGVVLSVTFSVPTSAKGSYTFDLNQSVSKLTFNDPAAVEEGSVIQLQAALSFGDPIVVNVVDPLEALTDAVEEAETEMGTINVGGAEAVTDTTVATFQGLVDAIDDAIAALPEGVDYSALTTRIDDVKAALAEYKIDAAINNLTAVVEDAEDAFELATYDDYAAFAAALELIAPKVEAVTAVGGTVSAELQGRIDALNDAIPDFIFEGKVAAFEDAFDEIINNIIAIVPDSDGFESLVNLAKELNAADVDSIIAELSSLSDLINDTEDEVVAASEFGTKTELLAVISNISAQLEDISAVKVIVATFPATIGTEGVIADDVMGLPSIDGAVWSLDNGSGLTVSADGVFDNRNAGPDAEDHEGVVFTLTATVGEYTETKTYDAVTVVHLTLSEQVIEDAIEALRAATEVATVEDLANLTNEKLFDNKAAIRAIIANMDLWEDLGNDPTPNSAIMRTVYEKLQAAEAAVKPFILTVVKDSEGGYDITVTANPAYVTDGGNENAYEGTYYVILQGMKGTTMAGVMSLKGNTTYGTLETNMRLPAGATSIEVNVATTVLGDSPEILAETVKL